MKTRIQLFAHFLILFWLSAFGYTTVAQGVSIDSSFGDNGVFYWRGSNFDAFSVAIQEDGNIIMNLAQRYYSPPQLRPICWLVRLKPDGTFDMSFGTKNGGLNAIAFQKDGKLVGAGIYSSLEIQRFNQDLSFDNSFGINSSLVFPSGPLLYGPDPKDITFQKDGKILVAGIMENAKDDHFGLVRINVNGTIDSTFDIDGIVQAPHSFAYATALVVQDDGKILVAGTTFGKSVDFVLFRFNIDGSIDNKFGNNGTIYTSFGQNADYGQDIAIQSNGKIIVAGSTQQPGTSGDFALARYHSNGSLDSTFGVFGKVVSSFRNGNDIATSMILQKDDKIILYGKSFNSMTGQNDGLIVRYDSIGNIENTLFIPNLNVTSFSGAVALQNDGKVVVIGNVIKGINAGNGYLARYIFDNNIPINTSDPKPSEMKISPNPISSQATIQFDRIFSDATLSIYNIYGLEVKKFNHLSGSTVNFYRDNLPVGLYFIQIKQDNKIIYTNNKIVITE